MEMTYDGELVMPSNYVAMDEEEMTYVEGGLTWNVMTVKVGAAIVNTAIGFVVGGGMAGGIAAFIKKKGAFQAAKLFSESVKSKLAAVGLSALAAAIVPAINFLDIGTAVCKYLDSVDAKKNNGWLTISILG